MDHVLNPALYGAMVRVFKAVKVQCPGEAMLDGRGEPINDTHPAVPMRDPVTEDLKLVIGHAGEYYLTSCPFCSDTRFRLYVSHMFGKRDAFGRRMSFLAVCYNETACMTKPENRHALLEMLSCLPHAIEESRIKPGKIVDESEREILLPGPVQRLDALPLTHKACDYLLGRPRPFDPHLLGRCYGVSYCASSHYTFAKDRIIVPIYSGGRLKGWQARYIGELAWKDKSKSKQLPPKYFSCPGMRRSRVIYNFDAMTKYASGILVEGPADVWSIGPMAGAIFGNTLSHYQRKQFVAHFRKRSGALVLDPEEFERPTTQREAKRLRHLMSGNLACVKLPEGTDPGALDREFLRDYIYHEAKEQGVTISWSRLDKPRRNVARGA